MAGLYAITADIRLGLLSYVPSVVQDISLDLKPGHLREAEIPEKYWLPPIMDWLLFTWYKNRNLPVSYLLKVYDDYSKKELSGFKRVKLQKELLHFQYSLKRLVSYT